MALTLRQGDVFLYPYLWNWQADKGEAEGRKDRPVCLALPLRKVGLTHVFLLAITGTPPQQGQRAIAIPEIEKRRAGLKQWKNGWIILGECNYDIVEHSFCLDPSQPVLGRFSDAFTARIKTELRAIIESGALARIDRTVS